MPFKGNFWLALALVPSWLGSAWSPHGSELCMRDGIPIEQRKNVTLQGRQMPLGIFNLEWDSAIILSEIVLIILQEAIGYNAVISGRGQHSPMAIHALAGCASGMDCIGSPELDDGFPPVHHLAFEAWAHADSQYERWLVEDSSRAPERLGLIGFLGQEGSFLTAESLGQGLQNNEYNLDWYRCYNSSRYDPSRFFAQVEDIDEGRLTDCQLEQHQIEEYYTHFPDDPSISREENGTWVMDCVRGKWWLSPACRRNTSRCVPYVDYHSWGGQMVIQQASQWDMALAIGTAATIADWRHLVANNKVLTYWWVPDNTLISIPLTLVSLPPHNQKEWGNGLKITSSAESFIYNWAVKGLQQAAYGAFHTAQRISINLESVLALLERFEVLQGGGLNHSDAACEWVVQNTGTWREWLPDPLACLEGQGMVDSLDRFDGINSSQAVNCQWCPPGRMSTYTNENRRVCKSCPPGHFQDRPGQWECLECAPGRFVSNETGLASGAADCQDCPTGSFSDRLGSTGCTPCDSFRLGLTTQSSGSKSGLSCQACLPGQFAIGLMPCQSCELGKITVAFGQSGCEDCPVGRSTPVEGSTRCQFKYEHLVICSLAFVLIATSVTLASLTLFRRVPIDDISTKEEIVIITTSSDHWLLPSKRFLRVTIAGTGDKELDGTFGVKRLSRRRLQLQQPLTGPGYTQPLEGCSGILCLPFPTDLVWTGWRFLRIALVIPILFTGGVGLLAGFFVPLYDSGAIVGGSAVIGTLGLIFRWHLSFRKASCSIAIHGFKKELHRRRRKSVIEMGPNRAVTLGQIWELLDAFRHFIRDRNMQFVVREFIKPITEDEKRSYAEMVGGSCLQWFVSHCWNDGFLDFATSLKTHAEQVTASFQGWKDVTYWACSFAINQWNVTEELGRHWSETSFFVALHSPMCRGTVMVIQETASPLTRSWCLFEIMQTFLIQKNRPPEDFMGLLLATRAGVLNSGTAPIDVLLQIADKISHVFFEEAQASMVEDKVMIDKAVQTHAGGFAVVNEFIRQQMREAVSTGQHKLENKISLVVSRLGIHALGGSKNLSYGSYRAADSVGLTATVCTWPSMLSVQTVAEPMEPIQGVIEDELGENEVPERPHASSGQLVKAPFACSLDGEAAGRAKGSADSPWPPDVVM